MTDKLYYRDYTEQWCVSWYKKGHKRGTWLQSALDETAYEKRFRNVRWDKPSTWPCLFSPLRREIWLRWTVRPYGHAVMNLWHQRAIQCIRRNVYFPERAKAIGKRKHAGANGVFNPYAIGVRREHAEAA